MNIIQKIRAFFTIKGKQEEMELTAAEIKHDGVFLHPVDDPDHTFFVKSNEVDIYINSQTELSEDDIFVIDNKKSVRESNIQETKKDTLPNDIHHAHNIRPHALSKFMPSKKRFSVMLYPDEYEMLMKNITEHGYKKVEYFLACMTSAKKQSMDAVYKRYTVEHAKRYKTDLSAAKRAQAEDFMSRQAEVDQPQI